MNVLQDHLISCDLKVSQILEKLNELGNDLTLFVIDSDQKTIGSVTDGDIRRGLLKGCTLNSTVQEVMQVNFKYIVFTEINIDVIREYKRQGIILLPLVDKEMRLKRIINLHYLYAILPIDVVIMAGGEGIRLRPLTEKTPKPLLFVGDKPILEHNIDRLMQFGVNNINICIKYLGEQIVEYFSSKKSKGINIKYHYEEEKLGTAGALSNIDEYHFDTILLMNADLLTNLDYEDFYRRFIESGADLMVASVPYTVNVPYAILETNQDHDVLSLKEKPSFTYYSNAGIYLIKKSCIDFVPGNKFYNATDLIDNLIANGKSVKYYPILQFWLDIGALEDYKKANEFIKHLKI